MFCVLPSSAVFLGLKGIEKLHVISAIVYYKQLSCISFQESSQESSQESVDHFPCDKRLKKCHVISILPHFPHLHHSRQTKDINIFPFWMLWINEGLAN